jgi:hypothetical protein
MVGELDYQIWCLADDVPNRPMVSHGPLERGSYNALFGIAGLFSEDSGCARKSVSA